LRKALIVWGGWPGHEPEKGAASVAKMLAEDGFDVEVTGDFTAFARPNLSSLSLIVPVITSAQIDNEPVNNLVAAVRSGVGIGGYHGAATAFRDKINYHFMFGAQWVQHPGDANVDYRVHIEKPYDPIVEGIADFANAFAQARTAGVVTQLGAAYYVPIVIVPAALVAHVMILGLLLRRSA